MKSFIKKSLLSLALICGLSFSSTASQIYVTNTVSSLTNLVIPGPAKVVSIQLVTGSTNFLLASLYDNAYSNIIYTNQAYTTITNYSTNVVLNYISPLTGFTNNMTNTMIVELTNSIAATTNNLLTPIGTWAAAPSSSPVFYLNAASPTSGGVIAGGLFSKGVVLTMSTNGAAIIVYRVND